MPLRSFGSSGGSYLSPRLLFDSFAGNVHDGRLLLVVVLNNTLMELPVHQQGLIGYSLQVP